MTLADLIRRFRVLAKDVENPPRADDKDVIDWLNDAQAQACVRGRLLVAEGDAALCHIPLFTSQTAYPLHRAVYELIHLQVRSATGCTRPVVLKTREWLEAEVPDWRNHPRPVCMAIQTDTGLRLVGKWRTAMCWSWRATACRWPAWLPQLTPKTRKRSGPRPKSMRRTTST